VFITFLLFNGAVRVSGWREERTREIRREEREKWFEMKKNRLLNFYRE